jgi:hypothetical protein
LEHRSLVGFDQFLPTSESYSSENKAMSQSRVRDKITDYWPAF